MTLDEVAMRAATKADALRRLDRVVGQARAVRGMVEEERAAADLLPQIHALRGALAALEVLFLAERIDGLYPDSGGAAQDAGERLKSLRETLRHHVGG